MKVETMNSRKKLASERLSKRLHRREDGYVLPLAMFAVAVMSILAVTALRTAEDEQRASRAVRESGAALVAAESGLEWYRGTLAMSGVPLVDSIAESLAAGDSAVLPWNTIPNGARYRAVVQRCAEGGGGFQAIVALTVEGRGAGPHGGQRVLRLFLTHKILVPKAILLEGNITISGNPSLLGPCSDIHANGWVDIPGNPTTDGDVSSADDVTVGGSLEDGNNNPVTPQSYGDSIPVPALNPMDYCGEADFFFRNGWVIEAGTMDSVNAATTTTHGWKYSGGIYTTDNSSVSPGTICADGNIEVTQQVGTPASPLSLTILTEGSVTFPADPYVVPDHSNNILVMADGDLKINGSPSPGDENYSGLLYAGSQCEISGSLELAGQLVCRDLPNPVGSEEWAVENKISGAPSITFECTNSLVAKVATPLAERAWNELLR